VSGASSPAERSGDSPAARLVSLPTVDPARPLARRRVLAGTLGGRHRADRSRGRPVSEDPSVVFFGGRYLTYYSVAPRPGDDRWGQAVAASDDLLSWTTVAEIEPQGSVEARGLCAGGAVVLGDRVHLFYQSYKSIRATSSTRATA